MSSELKSYYVDFESDGIQPRVSSKQFYDFFERFVVLPCKVIQVSHEYGSLGVCMNLPSYAQISQTDDSMTVTDCEGIEVSVDLSMLGRNVRLFSLAFYFTLKSILRF